MRQQAAGRRPQATGGGEQPEKQSANRQSGQPLPAACCLLPHVTSPSLATLDGVRHGFFGRAGGVSSGIYASLNCGLGTQDSKASVTENRARVARRLGGTDDHVVTLFQEHGARALVIDAAAPRENLPKADAVVTATPGLVIGVLTADCAPVLLADPEAGVIAAAHAGWRGAVAGILESALAAMEDLGARRDRVRAAVGPCISQDAYEVGPEFEAEFAALDPANARFFASVDGEARPRFDLAAYVVHRLTRAGVGAVDRATPCTFANESDYFSFRRARRRAEPDYGRQISAIVRA